MAPPACISRRAGLVLTLSTVLVLAIASPASGATTSTTAPPGTAILADSEAANHVRHSSWEPRPRNYEANHHVPSAGDLAAFRGKSELPSSFKDRITGNFKGTTDEIIQWAAWKWGLDEDIVRAVAHLESSWDQDVVGDNGLSFGLMQLKNTPTADWGTHPLSSESTPFNVDFYGAVIRYYYDGHARWMNWKDGRVGTYSAGDLWGSVGAWYSGNWHTPNTERYIRRVKERLAGRVWEQPGF